MTSRAGVGSAALWSAAADAGRDTADTDLELVVRAKEGDTEAFSSLVGRHQQLVYNLAYRFMRDATLAEDAAQEAFIKAYRLLGGFRGDCSFGTWMYRVTASVCLTELNRRKKRGEVELLPVHEDHRKTSDRSDSFDVPEMMHSCVQQLPNRYKRIVTLYYLKELPYEEIAHALQIPMGTLKTWMHRARGQLRKIVEKEFKAHGLP